MLHMRLDLPASIKTQLATYDQVLGELEHRRIRFCIGGSMALAAYTGGAPRNIKDLDLYVKSSDSPDIIAALNDLGFADYYDHLPYDREWIYRALKDDFIVEVVWQMVNRRAQVDDGWMDRGAKVVILGRPVTLMSVEELIWSKLYVLQRDRCDWPDILNLIECRLNEIDWTYFIERVGDDVALLYSVLRVYQWLSPEAAVRLPEWLRASMMAHQIYASDFESSRQRAALLDSREWFKGVMGQGGSGCSSAQ
jgi:hypothetical protein